MSFQVDILCFIIIWVLTIVQYPNDPATFELDEQFMIGSAILAAPVLTKGANAVIVYFPSELVWDKIISTFANSRLKRVLWLLFWEQNF